jgi:hypothetical protein
LVVASAVLLGGLDELYEFLGEIDWTCQRRILASV